MNNVPYRKGIIALLGLAALVVIAILVVLITQTRSAPPPPVLVPPSQAQSPEGVVRRYLEGWSAHDAAAMDACLLPALRGSDFEGFEHIGSIEIIACVEQSEAATSARFDPTIYENPYDTALVVADYTIHYDEAGQAFYLRDSATREGFHYWLVKESADGDWLIAMQGY
ncbi:MAG: DUF4829 domain-containing protein [Oscillospiraceae bacterium]|jgi:hypothetical protein|nr:DUF4829 domain-containing protein [Oscillospiraceae bacterium]